MTAGLLYLPGMKRCGLLSFLFFIVLSAGASVNTEWLAKTYNFGVIKEGDGPVTGKVRFVNKGSEATFISRVRPSCGCTGASYTTGTIEPGDTATITFTYNPIGRPGKFDKTVRVYVGKENELTVVNITGTVVGSEATLSSAYPIERGPLRLETLTVSAGEIKHGAARHLFLNVYNQGNDTIRPEWSFSSDNLTVELTPRDIPPGDAAVFGFHLKTQGLESNGPLNIPVRINPTGKKGDENANVEVTAVVVPDTRLMSVEEIDNGPRAYLKPEFVELGEIKGKKEVPFEFEILNEGKSEMIVDRVFSRGGLVAVTSLPKRIKPGKKRKVKGKLSVGSLGRGGFRVNVEVITNDGIHPVRIANLVGIKMQ